MRRLILLTSLVLISFFIIYPSAFLYSNSSLPDNNDTRLIAYIMGQVQNNLIHHQPLYYGTFFAPYQNTLTYSDLFLTSALLTLPLRNFTSSPIIIFNSALILGFVLTFLASFYLFDYLFNDSLSALFASILFNLSGFHLTYLSHLQMFSLWPILFCLLFFLRYLSRPKRIRGALSNDGANRRDLFLFFVFLTFQIAESIFPVYLLLFSCIAILLSFSSSSLRSASWRRSNPSSLWIATQSLAMTKQLIPLSILFLPLWYYLLFPYVIFHFSFTEAVRPIRDAAHFSLGLDEIFTKFHSFTLITLFLISMSLREGYSRRGNLYKSTQNFLDRHATLAMTKKLLLFCLLMSLGPVLKIFSQNLRPLAYLGLNWPIPLPYAVFYYLLPGFNGFRTPSRFIILAALAAVIFITHKLSPYLHKYGRIMMRPYYLLLITFYFLLLIEARLPLLGHAVDIQPPSVYKQVEPLPKSSIILELPILLWNQPGHEIESLRSLYSLEHRHQRLGGFSGFAPQAWIDLVQHLQTFGLDAENLHALQSLSITHIIENNHLFPLPTN